MRRSRLMMKSRRELKAAKIIDQELAQVNGVEEQETVNDIEDKKFYGIAVQEPHKSDVHCAKFSESVPHQQAIDKFLYIFQIS